MLKKFDSILKTRYGRICLQAFKFLLVGLPAFVVAIPLNAFLVEHCCWAKPLAYALTLFLQVTVNFFFCRWFVFTPDVEKPIWRQYIEFLGVVAVFRSLDWLSYSIIVSSFNIHYIIVQCANVVIFSLAKFFLSKRAIEGSGNRRQGDLSEVNYSNTMPE
jgi:putative flippase GtrA